MLKPQRAQVATLPARERAHVAVHERPDAPERANEDASGECLLQPQERTRERTQPRPVLGTPVKGLRIIERVSETRVDVVNAMQLAVALKRQPQRQGHDTEQAIR